MVVKFLGNAMDFCSAPLQSTMLNVVSSGTLSGLSILADEILLHDEGRWGFDNENAIASVALAELWLNLPRTNQVAGLADIGDSLRVQLQRTLRGLLRVGKDATIEDVQIATRLLQVHTRAAELLLRMQDVTSRRESEIQNEREGDEGFSSQLMRISHQFQVLAEAVCPCLFLSLSRR